MLTPRPLQTNAYWRGEFSTDQIEQECLPQKLHLDRQERLSSRYYGEDHPSLQQYQDFCAALYAPEVFGREISGTNYVSANEEKTQKDINLDHTQIRQLERADVHRQPALGIEIDSSPLHEAQMTRTEDFEPISTFNPAANAFEHVVTRRRTVLPRNRHSRPKYIFSKLTTLEHDPDKHPLDHVTPRTALPVSQVAHLCTSQCSNAAQSQIHPAFRRPTYCFEAGNASYGNENQLSSSPELDSSMSSSRDLASAYLSPSTPTASHASNTTYGSLEDYPYWRSLDLDARSTQASASMESFAYSMQEMHRLGMEEHLYSLEKSTKELSAKLDADLSLERILPGEKARYDTPPSTITHRRTKSAQTSRRPFTHIHRTLRGSSLPNEESLGGASTQSQLKYVRSPPPTPLSSYDNSYSIPYTCPRSPSVQKLSQLLGDEFVNRDANGRGRLQEHHEWIIWRLLGGKLKTEKEVKWRESKGVMESVVNEGVRKLLG